MTGKNLTSAPPTGKYFGSVLDPNDQNPGPGGRAAYGVASDFWAWKKSTAP